jgi:hypothetical protein
MKSRTCSVSNPRAFGVAGRRNALFCLDKMGKRRGVPGLGEQLPWGRRQRDAESSVTVGTGSALLGFGVMMPVTKAESQQEASVVPA